MARYKLTPYGMIFDSLTNKTIPSDPSNMDYMIYRAWLDQGNVPDPAETIPVPPKWQQLIKAISSRPAARAAFRNAGSGAIFSLLSAYTSKDETELLEVLNEVRSGILLPANQATFTARANELLTELDFTIRMS